MILAHTPVEEMTHVFMIGAAIGGCIVGVAAGYLFFKFRAIRQRNRTDDR